MSSTTLPQQDAVASTRLYRAMWRWHFYAGLYVIPFLIMLAVTGLIIPWFTAIAPEYGDRLTLQPGAQALSITQQADAALAAHPGAAPSANTWRHSAPKTRRCSRSIWNRATA